MISVQEALALVTLTPAEERALSKLEATVDAVFFSRFDGTPLGIELREDSPPKIIAALQRRYEQGGWRVVYVPEKRQLLFTPILFAMPGAKGTKPAPLPPVASNANLVAAPASMCVLVRMPTRGRPRQALDMLARYRAMAGVPINLEVVIDSDDATMNTSVVLQRLNALGCSIVVGNHKSKVEAVNAYGARDWDVLVLASDDMAPVVDGYAKRIVDAMVQYWPYLDGALHFDDGYQQDKCYTLPILGRRLYQRCGYRIYEPEYRSLWCDMEQTETLRALGRLKYVDECIIEHRHHAIGKAVPDALYKRNDALWDADKAVFEERRARNFDFGGVLFSICICTLPSRRRRLDVLYEHLWRQIHDGFSDKRIVEIVVDAAEGEIGAKRRRLLDAARGRFVAFVDDDDWVDALYVQRIVNAIQKHPQADCVELHGVMTTTGEAPELFHTSLQYDHWFTQDGVHRRSPNHLSPVLRERAIAAGFESISHGEDYLYSLALRPLLKHEAPTGSRPLYHYWYWPAKQKGE